MSFPSIPTTSTQTLAPLPTSGIDTTAQAEKKPAIPANQLPTGTFSVN